MATPTPNLTLTQYSTTDKINYLTQYNTDMDKIDDYAGATNTNIGTLASLKTAVKTSTVGAINEVYDTTDNGWISARATLTYASASGQNLVCTTNIDLTSRISVGMKIKLTQTTTKYFFVTAITPTTITLYGGTTYSVINATISNVYFSSVQLPYGFPIATAGLGVDFPIESGSNTNGRYTKFASGKLEMDGKITTPMLSYTATTNIFYAIYDLQLPVIPVGSCKVFTSVIGGGGAWGSSIYLDVNSGGVTTLFILKPSNVSASETISFHAIGSWK